MPPIPHHLILDPLAPIPADLSATQRRRLSELREAYRASLAAIERPTIRTPEEGGGYVRPYLAGLCVETLLLVPLDAGSRAISDPVVISRGDIDGTEAGPRPILRAALIAGAVSFMIAHNHPSGSPTPSAADLAVTERLAKGARCVDLSLVDHLIIAGSHTTSLRRDHPRLFTS